MGAAALVCAAAAWAGATAYRRGQCSGLEADYLNSVSQMSYAARTQGIARSMGSSGEAHELAIEVHARAMEYYLGQLSEQCGARDVATAERKGREIVGL